MTLEAERQAPAVTAAPSAHLGRGPGRNQAISRSVLLVASGLVLAQFVGLVLWSAHLADRSSLTFDFGVYFQASSQIAHGHLGAFDTLQGYPFWRNDGELILYVLAPLYWLFPNHVVGFLWLQDAAIAGVSALALFWTVERFPWRAGGSRREHAAAASCWLLVAVLLVANPWTYWVASFDLHMEPFGVLFAMLGLRAMLRGRRTALGWCLLAVLCGSASILFVIGVGMSALVVALWGRMRGHRRQLAAASEVPRSLLPAVVALVGAPLWLYVLGLVGATKGSVASSYAYLVRGHPSASFRPTVAQVGLGILSHPARAADVIASHGWNLWANTSPDGLVGLLSVSGFLMSAPTLLANDLVRSELFSYPSFQSFVVYPFVALGSVAVVAFLLRKRRLALLGGLLALAMVANGLGWFAAWFPSIGSHWVATDATAASVLRRLSATIPAGDEVVASQGFVGRFGEHRYLYAFSGAATVAVGGRPVWFVLSSLEGIETASPAETMEALDTVESLPGARLVSTADGISVVRWNPPVGTRVLELAAPGAHLPASTAGPAGFALALGPVTAWHVASRGVTGQVFANDYWFEPPGRYVARVGLQSNVPLTVEVWDVNTSRMIAAKVVPPSGHRGVASLAFSLRPGVQIPPPQLDAGSGLFRYKPVESAALPALSIVVSERTGGRGSIWWTSLVPAAR